MVWSTLMGNHCLIHEGCTLPLLELQWNQSRITCPPFWTLELSTYCSTSAVWVDISDLYSWLDMLSCYSFGNAELNFNYAVVWAVTSDICCRVFLSPWYALWDCKYGFVPTSSTRNTLYKITSTVPSGTGFQGLWTLLFWAIISLLTHQPAWEFQNLHCGS
jgi:hypothetical protein